MNHWLLKTEPETYSWNDLVKKGADIWDGVRNYAARKNMMAMAVGDRAFIYHSGDDREIVGIAELTKEHFPDPTTEDDRWVVVELKAISKLKRPVSLQEIKADERLRDIDLVRLGRLSVQTLSPEAYQIILEKSETN